MVSPITPSFESLSSLNFGINSSTTTYIIAPAAKANKYGNIKIIFEVNNSVINAKTGSTIPEKKPYKNDFHLDNPEDFKGIEIMMSISNTINSSNKV